MTEYTELCALAIKAMQNSYSPYSNFRVGAALLSASGKVYTGCNVENSAYGECICAERTAFVKAVSEGEKEFVAIAIVGGKNGKIELPNSIQGHITTHIHIFKEISIFQKLNFLNL